MSSLDPRQAIRLSLVLLASLAVLPFSACDHAKDLVEQGKKQAQDLQKSIEGKSSETATNSPPAARSSSSAKWRFTVIIPTWPGSLPAKT